MADDSLALPHRDFSTKVAYGTSVNPRIEPLRLQRMDGRSYSQLHSSDSMKRLLGVDQEFWCVKQSMQSLPCASDRLNYTEESRKLCSVTSLTLHGSVSQIRSPSRASGELKEQSPHHSFRSHSGTTTPNKSSPERFLFIDSEDSDFEVVNHVNTNQNNCSVTQPTPHCQQYRGIPHKGKRLRVSVCSSPDGEEQRARSSGSGSSLDEGAATDNADSLRSGAPLPLHGKFCVCVCVCGMCCCCCCVLLLCVLLVCVCCCCCV